MKKCVALIGIVILLQVALTVAPIQAAEKDPIHMGLICDFSGPSSAMAGQGYAARDYFTYYNSRYGGINGHPIKFLMLDGAGDTAKEVAAYKHILTSVPAVTMRIWSTGGNKALRTSVNEKDRIPTIAESSLLDLNDPVKLPYHFVLGATAEDEMMMIMDWVQRLGGKSMVVLGNTAEFSLSPAKNVLGDPYNYPQKIGLKVLDHITYQYRPTDVTAEMLRAKSLNPDFYLVWDNLDGCIPVLRAAGELGLPMEKFFLYRWGMHPLTIERAGAEGVKAIRAFPNVDEAVAKGFPVGKEIDEFRAKNKIFTTNWEYLKGWCESRIHVEVVKRALEKNNNTVPKDIMVFRKMVRDEFEGLKNWDAGIGLPAPADFSNHKGWTWVTPMIVKKGKWEEYGPMIGLGK